VTGYLSVRDLVLQLPVDQSCVDPLPDLKVSGSHCTNDLNQKERAKLDSSANQLALKENTGSKIFG